MWSTLGLPSSAAAAIFCLCLSTGTALARTVQFAVVAFPTSSVEVSVNGGPPLTMYPPDVNAPYYLGIFDAPDSFSYKYLVDGTAEPFERSLDTSRSKTYNDFYGREKSVDPLPRLPHPFDDSWSRSLGLTPLFDDSYIPTIHLAGDINDINTVFQVMVNVSASVTMTMITADYVKRMENVRYEISAAGRKMNYAKQAYRLKLQKGDLLFGRDEWKLRCGEEDPTQMREKTYMAMMNALGCPVIQGNHARLYVNKEPIGLFILNDDADQKSTIRANFHGTPETALSHKAPVGTVIECNAFDFSYTPGPDGYYGLKISQIGNNPISAPYQSLQELTRQLSLVSGDSGLDKFNQYLDLETFMRAMVMEYLTVHWDSTWGMGSNFIMYEDTITKKWFLSDQDFDMTMGASTSASGMGSNATQLSYKVYMSNQNRPLMQKIFASPKYLARFEAILVATVKHMFNPVALGGHFSALHARIRPDVEWDRSLPRRSPGRPDNWKFADFDTNLNSPVSFAEWGVNQWVSERATAVANEFGFQWDATPNAAPDPVTTPPAEPTNAAGIAKSAINKDNVPKTASDASSLAASSVLLCGIVGLSSLVVQSCPVLN